MPSVPLRPKALQPLDRTSFFTELHYTRLTALCPGLPRWAGTRTVKPIRILLKQETVSGSGISWAICTLLQTDNHASTPPLKFFLQAGCPSCRPTKSIKALKAYYEKHFFTEVEWKCCWCWNERLVGVTCSCTLWFKKTRTPAKFQITLTNTGEYQLFFCIGSLSNVFICKLQILMKQGTSFG